MSETPSDEQSTETRVAAAGRGTARPRGGAGSAGPPAVTGPPAVAGPPAGGDAPRAESILLTVIGVAYTVLAIAAVARTGYQALTGTATSGRAGTAVTLSGVAGLVYLIAAIGLRRRTARSLLISRWCCAVELGGVIVVSLVEIGVGGFGRAAVWSGFGVGYGYLPLVLPLVGLWVTRPSALARMAASSRTPR